MRSLEGGGGDADGVDNVEWKRCDDDVNTGRQGRSCRKGAAGSSRSCHRAATAEAGGGYGDDEDAYCSRRSPPAASFSSLQAQVSKFEH